MKTNPLLMEIARGTWFFHPQSLQTWGVIAHQILQGNRIEEATPSEPKSLVSIFDTNGNRVKPNEKGETIAPKNSIAMVDLVGPMIKYGDWCSYGTMEIAEALWQAEKNPNIVGIVLNVDGPGGSVSSIAPMVDFGARKTKPVVAVYDMACSAHVYAMLSVADYVMANNTISSVFGSIGVMLSFADNKKYLEKLGYVFHDIYPEESEDKNKPFMLALEGNYELIKTEMLSPLAIKFQEAVKAARPNLKANYPGALTGKTFYAEEALEIGFIDGFGNMQDAIEMVKVLAEIKNLKINV